MKKLLSTLSLVAAVSLNANVLATIDGKEITEKELMQGAPSSMDFSKLPNDAQKQLINRYIENKLLVSHALKSDIQKSENYKNKLELLKNQLALQVWMENEFLSIKISDDDAKKYYDNNSDKFIQPASAKARHILLKTEADAKKIINELKKLKGKSLEDKFIALAKEKSTGPSAPNGGDLGWFGETQMVPEFSKATFALKKGEITKTAIKTQFGYHVIFLEDKKDAQKQKFDDIKEQIKQGLQLEKHRKSIEEKVASLKKDAKVEIKIK